MKVRLLGLGAVGAPLAVKLAPVCDFAILLDEGRLASYRQEGRTVNGKRYDFPAAMEAEAGVDLVILACKNQDLPVAMDVIAPHIGQETVIMSLLNGIDSEERLAARFGRDKVLWSFITNLSSVREGSSIDCFSPRGGQVIFNEHDSIVSPRVQAIAALFDQAGIWYSLSDDIIHDIWWKWSLNICINSLSAIMHLDYSQMDHNPGFIRALRMVYHEIRIVAKAEGVALGPDDEERVLRVLDHMDGAGRTSMLQDVEAGRETENRFMALHLSTLGRRHAVETPLVDFLGVLVEASSYAARL